MATNIEIDEATYEDDSLHAENEMPDEMPDSTTNTDSRGSKKRSQTASETWAHAKKFDGIVLVIRFGLAANVHGNQAP